jgi:multiple sugar transport system permease protein
VTVLLFAFDTTCNNYILPQVVLSSRTLLPVTVGLAQMNAAANAGGGARVLFSVVLTGALVAIVPLVIGFFLLQRFLRGGLSLGSVK